MIQKVSLVNNMCLRNTYALGGKKVHVTRSLTLMGPIEMNAKYFPLFKQNNDR